MAQHDSHLRALIAAKGWICCWWRTASTAYCRCCSSLGAAGADPDAGVNPVSFSSPDAIFYGPRIPPELRRSLGELPWLDEPTRQLQREVQQSFDAALAEAGRRR